MGINLPIIIHCIFLRLVENGFRFRFGVWSLFYLSTYVAPCSSRSFEVHSSLTFPKDHFLLHRFLYNIVIVYVLLWFIWFFYDIIIISVLEIRAFRSKNVRIPQILTFTVSTAKLLILINILFVIYELCLSSHHFGFIHSFLIKLVLRCFVSIGHHLF